MRHSSIGGTAIVGLGILATLSSVSGAVLAGPLLQRNFGGLQAAADDDAVATRFQHAYTRRVLYSPDGKLLASTGVDCTIRLWDAATGKEVRRLKGHTNPIDAIAFSPDGTTMASAANPEPDQTFRLWDVATGKELWSTTLKDSTAVPGNGPAWNVAFSPDGKLLVVGGNPVCVFDLKSKKEIRRFEVSGSFALSPDGRILASGATPVRLWSLATGKDLGQVPGGDVFAFSPDGKTLATVSFERKPTISLWEMATLKERQRLRFNPLSRKDWISSIAFAADGKTVITTGATHKVSFWDPATGREVRRLGKAQAELSAVALSPDGKTAITAGDPERLRVWDAATSEERTFKAD